jgi:hypothetical protein
MSSRLAAFFLPAVFFTDAFFAITVLLRRKCNLGIAALDLEVMKKSEHVSEMPGALSSGQTLMPARSWR